MRILSIIIIVSSIFLSKSTMKMEPEDKKAGIYFLYIHFDDELREQYKVSTSSRNILNSYSESEIISDNILDSIKTKTENLCTTKLGYKTSCIYKTSRKGKQISTVGANGELEQMPTNTLNSSIANNNLDYYIRIDVKFQAGGKAIIINGKKDNTIKPKVTAHIKVFDKNKVVSWKNKVTLKDFSELRFATSQRGHVTERLSETISPNDIYFMYLETIEMLLK